MEKVMIIGGGAAGMMSSLLIKKRHPDWCVSILEADDRLGRKLLKTGNGRCNLSHDPVLPENYNHPDWIAPLLSWFPVTHLHSLFKELGFPLKIDQAGRVYPESESAASFRARLESLIKRVGVEISCGKMVRRIQRDNLKFVIDSETTDIVILATGGKSQTKATGDALETSLSLSIVPKTPVLVGIKTVEDVKTLAGVRRKAVLDAGSYQEKGEVQFKADGVSGIVMMNYSRKSKDSDAFTLDLVPDMTLDELNTLLAREEDTLSILLALFPRPLALYFSSFPRHEIAQKMKAFVLHRKATYGFADAQVTRGGISLASIGRDFQVKSIPHLYAIGEALDIDGECGGYNLHFAWLSAALLARSL